jgi:hypothetical protein
LHASHAAFPILSTSEFLPVLDAAKLLVFSQIMDKAIRNLKLLYIALKSSSEYYSHEKDERA